jgi:hypothetical protein
MNRYHIELISSSQKIKRTVEADGMAWSDSGLYEFWIYDEEKGSRVGVAYYPVNRTIVENIEYNINKTI